MKIFFYRKWIFFHDLHSYIVFDWLLWWKKNQKSYSKSIAFDVFHWICSHTFNQVIIPIIWRFDACNKLILNMNIHYSTHHNIEMLCNKMMKVLRDLPVSDSSFIVCICTELFFKLKKTLYMFTSSCWDKALYNTLVVSGKYSECM